MKNLKVECNFDSVAPTVSNWRAKEWKRSFPKLTKWQFLLFYSPYLNGWSYRVEIALYFEVFQRRLIWFFKKLSSISRSRDIVISRGCLQTLFLGKWFGPLLQMCGRGAKLVSKLREVISNPSAKVSKNAFFELHYDILIRFLWIILLELRYHALCQLRKNILYIYIYIS